MVPNDKNYLVKFYSDYGYYHQTITKNYDEMVAFCSEKLGLKQVLTKPNMAVFLMPNGDVFEIMAPQIDTSQPELEKMECPKAEFLVDDVHQARQEMEATVYRTFFFEP